MELKVINEQGQEAANGQRRIGDTHRHPGQVKQGDRPVNGGVKTGHGAEQKSATAAPA